MNYTSVDLLNLYLQEGNEENLQNNITSDHVFTVLPRIEFITEELFGFLQKKSIITNITTFESIKPFLVEKDLGFSLPETLRTALLARSEKLELQTPGLFSVLEHFYKDKLDEGADSLPVYKCFYSALIKLLIKKESEDLNDCLIKYTPVLVYKEEYKFLSPLIRQVYDLFSATEQNGDSEKTMLGIILTWISVINNDEKRYHFAKAAAESAVQIFDEIKTVRQDAGAGLVSEWKGFSLSQIAGIDALKNDFEGAISNYEKSIALSGEYADMRMLYYVYLSLGAFDRAENLLIKMKNDMDVAIPDKNSALFIKENSYLQSDISTYYIQTGFFNDGISLINVIFPMFSKNPINHALISRNLGVALLKEIIITGKTPSSAKIKKALKLLSFGISKSSPEENIISHLWLARYNLTIGNIEKAWEYFQQGYSILLQNINLNRKEYTEYYITYKQFAFEGNQIKFQNISEIEIKEHLLPIYREIAPVIAWTTGYINLVSREYAFPTNTKSYVDRLINPEIRTAGFEKKGNQNLKALLIRIRKECGMLLPKKDDLITIEVFSLPFFKTYDLIRVYIKSTHITLIRYVLYSEIDMILLDKQNHEILRVARSEININTHEDAILYICFYFDVVEGRHGRFHIMDSLETSLPWLYNVTEKEKLKHLKTIKNIYRAPRFLFDEIKKEGNLYWHFSNSTIFKDAVFSTIIELCVTKGTVRIYEEHIAIEGLPFAVDIKSRLNLN